MATREKKSTKKPDLKSEICARIADGEPLRQICRAPGMPAWRTVYDWIEADKDFAARIARARALGFDAIAEEALEIANTPVLGEETEDDGEKVKIKTGDMLGHRKLQVETRLKLLAKWCPEKYGEKRSVDLTVNDSLAERLARARARAAG
ncbi:terminase [Acidovorax sp.]|uniref:terminase small subunit-like protein n=1 Tax=Acidovorax sp. TaxID=1872122 RepID=UPI0025B91EE3|nr:terminase [Acidovorax sp.]